MKLATLFLLMGISVTRAQNVVVKDVGNSRMILFSPTQSEYQGKVKIGNTITIAYLLRVFKGQRSRFIVVDSEKVGKIPTTMKENVPVARDNWQGGFLVSDTAQDNLNVTITQRLWKKASNVRTQDRLKTLEKTLSSEANMSVTLKRENGHPVQIEHVYIN